MRVRVTLGHLSTVVRADTTDEAIKKARKFFVEDWPRLYDLIMAKPLSEFHAEVVQ